MKFSAFIATLVLASSPSLRAEAPIRLTKAGVACHVGDPGTLTLGIPALDGRNAHAGPIPASIETDGRELTAKFGPPFDGVTLKMKLLADGTVEYCYDFLPDDVRVVMCQFNLPADSIVPGLTVTFDQMQAKKIPAAPGKTNDAVRLASANARSLEIKWPSGETLSLTAANTCWHGIQDSRVWGKNFVGICLTPPLKRDEAGGKKSTFVMTFNLTPAQTRKEQ